MKAYRVWHVSEDFQDLVFANHHSTAKWEVAQCYVCEYKDFRAQRLPHMDGYADPFSKRGYIEQAKHLQRLSGIYHCERCGGPNGDGSLCCAKCETRRSQTREGKRMKSIGDDLLKPYTCCKCGISFRWLTGEYLKSKGWTLGGTDTKCRKCNLADKMIKEAHHANHD